MIGTSLFFAAVLAATGPEVQVDLLDGGRVTGTLSQLSADQITIQSDGKAITLPSQRLLWVVPQKTPEPSAESPTAWIELVDGSKLTDDNFGLVRGTESGTADWYGPRTGALHIVRFSRPGDPASPAWPDKIAAEATGDLVVVRKKDSVDFLEGQVESVNKTHVVLRLDGQPYPIAREKVDGIIFYHKAGEALPDPVCVVETNCGWRLKAQEIFVSDAVPELRAKLAGGVEIPLPWETITRLDFSVGKIVYLSDLEPESVRWTPYLDFHKASAALEQFYAPRRDEGREHQPLVIGGKTYPKGLSLYSRTEMTFRLPGGAKTFKATAGIDDAVRDVGGVRLEISADGKKLLDKSISGGDQPLDIDLNVAGAKRLSILVDYGDGVDAGDYLDLAEARILK